MGSSGQHLVFETLLSDRQTYRHANRNV